MEEEDQVDQVDQEGQEDQGANAWIEINTAKDGLRRDSVGEINLWTRIVPAPAAAVEVVVARAVVAQAVVAQAVVAEMLDEGKEERGVAVVGHSVPRRTISSAVRTRAQTATLGKYPWPSTADMAVAAVY